MKHVALVDFKIPKLSYRSFFDKGKSWEVHTPNLVESNSQHYGFVVPASSYINEKVPSFMNNPKTVIVP